MDKKTRHIILKSCKDLPDRYLRKIEEYGTLTGSQVFGGADASDFDWILPQNFRLSWDRMFNEELGWYHPQEYVDPDFRAIYVRKGRMILNLLYMNNEEIRDAWIRSTAIMKKIIGMDVDLAKKIAESKMIRITIFEVIKKSIQGEDALLDKITLSGNELLPDYDIPF